MSEEFVILSQLTRNELYLCVNELKREINCLSTDLSRFQLLAKKYENYSNYLQTVCKQNKYTINKIDYKFKQEINALKHLKQSLVSVNRLNVDNYTNVISETDDSIPLKTNPKTTGKTVSKGTVIVKQEPKESDVDDEEVDLDVKNQTNDNSAEEYSNGSGDDSAASVDTDGPSVAKRWKEKAFVCDVEGCRKSYRFRTNLYRHRLCHFGRRYYCSVGDCNQHFGYTSALWFHNKDGPHVFGGQPYVCGIKGCSFETTVKDTLESHIVATHPYRSSDPLPCGHCGQEFTTKSHLAKHVREVHTAVLPFKCEECGRRYRSEFSLQEHYCKKHAAVNRTDDDIHEPRESGVVAENVGLECDVNFVSNEVIIGETIGESVDNLHNVETVNNAKPEIAGSSGNGSAGDTATPADPLAAATSWVRSVSKRKQTRPKGKYACDVDGCKMSYSNPGTLRHHRRAHFGRRFYCPYKDCNQHFGNGSTFWRHTKEGLHVLGGQPYVCGIQGCEFDTGLRAELESHIVSAHRDYHRTTDPFPCDQCGREFNRKELLEKHRLKEHSDDMPYKCDYCERRFRSTLGLKTHRQRKRCMTFRCHWPGCQFKTPYRLLLYRVHAITHTGGQDLNPSTDVSEDPNEMFRCEVDGCDKAYGTVAGLKVHRLLIHSTSVACNWPGCEFTAGIPSAIERHRRVVHTDDRPHQCPIDGCEYSGREKGQLKIHQIRVHPEDFPSIAWYECPEADCGFRTKCKYSTATHIKGHQRLHECDVCGKRLGTKCQLVVHLKAHKEPIRCSWPGCDVVVGSEATMKDHYNTHTRAIVYRCPWPGCDKTFLQRTSFFHHKRTHNKSGGRLRRCDWPECDYETYNGALYKRHIDRHNGVKPIDRRKKRPVKPKVKSSPSKRTKKGKKRRQR